MSRVKQYLDSLNKQIEAFEGRRKIGPYLIYCDGKFVLLVPDTEFLLSKDVIDAEGFICLYRTLGGTTYQLSFEPASFPLTFFIDSDRYETPDDLPDGQYNLSVWGNRGPFQSKYCNLKTVESIPYMDAKY
ncbi:hypothetical protein [Mariprofundus ferrooxydans]|uniref:hypothetical protein n=1 Tax=Mariprofundus ferrooxydans TaxID=314344 RepID=UPI00037B4867|nr:hypothetical protein [Mariprofundus ferrooxydans]